MSNFAVPMELPKFSAAIADVKSDFPLSRLSAVVALSLADDEHIQEASDLLESLLEDFVEEIRVQVVESLAVLAERGAIVKEAGLQSMLQDDSVYVQCTALESLHAFKKNPIQEALSASYRKDDAIRRSAALLLGALEDDRAKVRIHEMLHDESLSVRQMAALHHGAPFSETALSILEDVVRFQGELAQEALVVLACESHPRSADVIHAVATSRFAPLELRTTAAAALLNYNVNNADVPTSQFLNSRWKSRRLAMLQALSLLPSACVADHLKKIVGGANREEEASAALHALFQGAFQFHELRVALFDLQGELTGSVASELEDYIKKVKDNE